MSLSIIRVFLSFGWFDTSQWSHFSKKGHFVTSKNRISSYATLVFLGPHSLDAFHITCQFLSWVTILYSCFHGPHQTYFVSQRHQVTLIQSIRNESHMHPWSLFHIPLYHVTIFHPYLRIIHPVLPILASSHIVSHPLRSWVSRCEVNHALYALIKEVICLSLSRIIFHYPWCQSISHIIIFSCALVEDPHWITYCGPYFFDTSSFILEEWPRGRCILVPSSILPRYIGSSKGSHYFPLNWLFHASNSYTWWCSDVANCTIDCRVCVRCFRAHDGVALQVAPHMPSFIPIML